MECLSCQALHWRKERSAGAGRCSGEDFDAVNVRLIEIIHGYGCIEAAILSVFEIFTGMKMLEERQNACDEHEYREANFANRGGSGQ